MAQALQSARVVVPIAYLDPPINQLFDFRTQLIVSNSKLYAFSLVKSHVVVGARSSPLRHNQFYQSVYCIDGMLRLSTSSFGRIGHQSSMHYIT
jgi:hypothetical protein